MNFRHGVRGAATLPVHSTARESAVRLQRPLYKTNTQPSSRPPAPAALLSWWDVSTYKYSNHTAVDEENLRT